MSAKQWERLAEEAIADAGEWKQRARTAERALNAIHVQLSGREWSADDLEAIAGILESAGLVVLEPADADDLRQAGAL